ncbi:hypothetical protein IFM89_006892 [Coptis chinensis]|uniref:RDRP C-terminal head domain-containing protein n=1 Tax=Coptis chinensis TaxID=261450 RepID=A0A835GZI9_9MAGN|nr:hypothetical protein IFM89_006892 [Coptis chinensis]
MLAPQTSCLRSFTGEVAKRSFVPDMEVDGFENFLDDTQYYKGEYDFKLGNLMDYYEIKTRSIKKEARTWFEEKSSTSGTQEDNVYAKVSAWYRITYHPDYWGCYNEGMNRSHFLSFPWCVYDKLIHIKRMNSQTRSN